MKVKTKLLVEYLKKIQMDGSEKIKEVLMRFEESGLKISATAITTTSRVSGILNTTAFEEYKAIGNVGLNDFETFIKVLNRFGEKITLEFEGNLLTIKGEGKKVDVELTDEEFLETDTKEPAMEFDDNFILTAKQLNNIVEDAKLNADSYVTFETSEKKLEVSNTGKYKFKHTINCPTLKGGVNVKFGNPIVDSTSQLTGNLEFSMKTDFPCKVREKTEHSVITIIVAPRTGDE
jgi:hypothetical protein